MISAQTRLQAFRIHLTLSLVIFLATSFVILNSWFPGHFKQFGGLRAVALIGGIDFLLGPLLTLLIYNTKKKHLKWDIAAIALIQSVALTYGIASIYQGRPIAQILTPDGIYIATEADRKFYKITDDELKNTSIRVPLIVYLELPADSVAISQIEFVTGFFTDRPLALRTDLYRQYPPQNAQYLEFLLAAHKYDHTKSCYLVPVTSSHADLLACFNPNTARLEPI